MWSNEVQAAIIPNFVLRSAISHPTTMKISHNRLSLSSRMLSEKQHRPGRRLVYFEYHGHNRATQKASCYSHLNRG